MKLQLKICQDKNSCFLRILIVIVLIQRKLTFYFGKSYNRLRWKGQWLIFLIIYLDCNCDPNGSEALTCDAETGQCHCKCNVIGDKCDTCASGFHNFPATADENCHGMIWRDFLYLF